MHTIPGSRAVNAGVENDTREHGYSVQYEPLLQSGEEREVAGENVI